MRGVASLVPSRLAASDRRGAEEPIYRSSAWRWRNCGVKEIKQGGKGRRSADTRGPKRGAHGGALRRTHQDQRQQPAAAPAAANQRQQHLYSSTVHTSLQQVQKTGSKIKPRTTTKQSFFFASHFKREREEGEIFSFYGVVGNSCDLSSIHLPF